MINIGEAATRKIGPLPAFAWGGIVGGGILAFKMLRGDGNSGASSPFVQPVGGPGMDFDDHDSGGGSGGSGGTPTPPPIGSGTTGVVNTQATTYKLSLLSRTNLYNTSGKVYGAGASGTYTATILNLFGKKWYKFKRRNAAGNLQWTLVPVGTKTVRVTPVT